MNIRRMIAFAVCMVIMIGAVGCSKAPLGSGSGSGAVNHLV